MKVIRQEVRKYVTKYQAEDGQIFDTESQCRDHEARIKGTRRICTNCNGKGYISEDWHDVLNELTYQVERVEYSHTCNVCGGKGYLDKKEVWT